MKFGCTSPFGINIDQICTDRNQSQEAMKLYQNLIDKRFTIKECPFPCTFMKTVFRSKAYIDSGDYNGLQLIFNKFITTTKARYAYRELELLAEFGGYVGLFLGISVFNFMKAFGKMLKLFVKVKN